MTARLAPSEVKLGEKTQRQKFEEAARELETDDDEKRFDERLGKIAKSPPQKDEKPEIMKPAK
ncbi:DNA-binding protein [Rhizobium mongolense]|uniref:DNA-binding protein n=1 Tax=Rhizobium mongolense TaxID=57676 RepID=UPI0034A56D37